MTREHKLAMIVGFALVLVVGVLVSDHLSGARKARMANVDMAGQEMGAREVDVAFGRKPEPAPTVTIAKAPVTFDGERRGADPAEAEVPLDTIAANTTLNEEPGHVIDIGALSFRQSNPPAAIQTETTGERLVMGAPTDIPPGFTSEPRDSIKPLGGERDIINLTNDTFETVADPAPPKTEKAKTRTVKEGDTLWSIADDVYSDGKLHKKLAEYNKSRLGSGGQLRVGASILIPDKNVLLGKAPETKVTEAPKAEKQPNSIATKTEVAKKSGKNSYVVKAGDTLGAIAKRELGSAGRWEEILEANPDLDDENSIRAGMTLKLPR